MTTLIGCKGVTTPNIDLQAIGVQDKTFTTADDGKTTLRDKFDVTDTDADCRVPLTAFVVSRSENKLSNFTTDGETEIYFCNTTDASIDVIVDDTVGKQTFIKTANANTLTLSARTGNIDGNPTLIVDYLTPATIVFDGSNWWTI